MTNRCKLICNVILVNSFLRYIQTTKLNKYFKNKTMATYYFFKMLLKFLQRTNSRQSNKMILETSNSRFNFEVNCFYNYRES